MTTIPFPASGRGPLAKLPPPPRHLEKPERELWKKIVLQRDFAEDAPRAVLGSALDAHARARRCREIISRDGEVISDRFGAPQKHPLLTAESAAQSQFSRDLRLLGILS